MDTNEDGHSAISGSLENARELLSAARTLLDADQPARLAYHFAAFALEEVGKASILGMRVVRSARERDLPSLFAIREAAFCPEVVIPISVTLSGESWVNNGQS